MWEFTAGFLLGAIVSYVAYSIVIARRLSK